MALILAKFSPAGRRTLESIGPKLLDYLPLSPTSTQYLRKGKCEAAVFSFGAALDRPVREYPNEALFCHGYGDRDLEVRVAACFAQALPLKIDAFPEAFCAVLLTPEALVYGGSAVGVDPLFVLTTEDGDTIVTNRHNLLAPWAAGSPLNKRAFAWMIGRNHIGDYSTYWQNICRTRPGSTYSVAGGGIEEAQSSLNSLFEPIATADIPEHVASLSRSFTDMVDGAPKARLWLSGGKDSRAIAGMLSRSPNFRNFDFSTHGEEFAPDVMAARDVAGMLGVTDSHRVARSSISNSGFDVAAGIATDLLADSVGSSLADFRSVGSADMLIFGGHENGYKVKPNELALDEYLRSRRYWCDNQAILQPHAYDEINCWYSEALRHLLEGAPPSRYPQMDAVVFRNGTYLAGSQINTHVSRSEVHPFLDGRLLKLLMGVSDEALENQFIHYAMVRSGETALEIAPFAADKWPAGLKDMAAMAAIPFRGEPAAPYVFQEFFPSQKVFGGYSWRLDLISRTRNFVLEYVSGHASFFDFIKLDRLAVLSSRPVNELKIMDFYFHLACLKACLVHAFRDDDALFSFAGKSVLAGKISTFFDARPTKSKSAAEAMAEYDEKLSRYEGSIAAAVRAIRAKT